MDTTQLLTITFIIGITAEAVTASLSAGRMKMDWFGIVALASITALGGGTIRDILLANYPLTWVGEPTFLVIVIIAALVTAQLAFLAENFTKVFLTADAVGLATFSVTGTKAALELGHGIVIAAVAATVTGVAGGIMRDILSDRVPLVFSSEIYAAVAVMTTALYMFLLWVGMPENGVIVISLVFAFALRMIAIKMRWQFPQFEYQGKDTPVDPRLRLSAQFLSRGVKGGVRGARRQADKLRGGYRRVKGKIEPHDPGDEPGHRNKPDSR